ncbi:hypothetical protein ACEWY4_011473 [Coilia grayii]|uniref:Uncharacterized protein n=1 Tax=Coilia grayii TaxID=363190 RepID=A0ABD1K4V6_9TELE
MAWWSWALRDCTAQGLLLLDGEQTGASPAPPAGSLPPAGSFHALCNAQQQQLLQLQDTQHTEISSAPSPLEAQLLSARHGEALFQLAEEQRYAHEYGDTSVTPPQPVHTPPLETPPLESTYHMPCSPQPVQTPLLETLPLETPPLQDPSPVPCCHLDARGVMPTAKHSVHTPPPPQQCDLLLSAAPTDPRGTDGPARRPSPPTAPGRLDQGQARQRPRPPEPPHAPPHCTPGSRHAALDLRSLAAVVIQKHWRGYQCRIRKCPPERPVPHGKCSPLGEARIGAALPEAPRDRAAAVIQAAWRGHALRSRLARALAAAAAHTRLDQDEDDQEALAEVDVDQFVFNEGDTDVQLAAVPIPRESAPIPSAHTQSPYPDTQCPYPETQCPEAPCPYPVPIPRDPVPRDPVPRGPLPIPSAHTQRSSAQRPSAQRPLAHTQCPYPEIQCPETQCPYPVPRDPVPKPGTNKIRPLSQ